MSTHSHSPAVTRGECVLCGPGRPCGHDLARHLPIIPANYPFMTPAQIAATAPPVDEPTAEPITRRRAAQDRMRRPEHHDHAPREDR